jgi:hypothetical protein
MGDGLIMQLRVNGLKRSLIVVATQVIGRI